ncbi:MAG: hypothetical protein LBL86_00775 [Coriobacteriales bacterium]|nr:hypothetical protein [Coriobacteriales bacterium]
MSISGATTKDTIFMENIDAKLTLENLSVDVSGTVNAAALDVKGGSLTLTLVGTNTLKSGSGRAGLQLREGANLTITAASDGAGLTATGGGGPNISAAGIGGGAYSIAGAVTITGGSVTAEGRNSNSQDIGNGYDNSPAASVVIDGGSVWATSGRAAYGNGILPRNSNGAAIYANTLTVGSPAMADNVSVTVGIIDGIPCSAVANATGGVYGINDVVTTSAGKVCFWLPTTGDGGTSLGGVGLVAGGKDHELSYARPGARTETLVIPAISEVKPDGSAENVGGDVIIRFNVSMDTDVIGTVEFQPCSGAPIPLAPAADRWNGTGTIYTVSYSGLDYATAYTIRIKGFESAVFNSELDSGNTSFATVQESHTASPDLASKAFDTVTAGYARPPAAQRFTITNTGTAALTGVRARLSGGRCGLHRHDAFIEQHNRLRRDRHHQRAARRRPCSPLHPLHRNAAHNRRQRLCARDPPYLCRQGQRLRRRGQRRRRRCRGRRWGQRQQRGQRQRGQRRYQGRHWRR